MRKITDLFGVEERYGCNMKREKITLGLGFVVIMALAFVIIWQADIVGVAQGRLEQNARKSQEIASDWLVAQDVNEDMCAMLFYDEAKKDCTYSIYLSEEENSFGYFYKMGGYDAYMDEDAKAVIFEDRGIVLLSMNRDGVCTIEMDNGTEQQYITVDPQKPYALVLPLDCGEITLYDSNENIVTLYDTYTG